MFLMMCEHCTGGGPNVQAFDTKEELIAAYEREKRMYWQQIQEKELYYAFAVSYELDELNNYF